LVEQQSDLSGGNWVVSATYLKGVGLVRRNNEFHHFDVLGTAGVITNASGAVLSTNVYDAFGVSRYVSGNAQTQWRWLQAEEEGLVHGGSADLMPGWGVVLQQRTGQPTPPAPPRRNCQAELNWCMTKAGAMLTACLIVVGFAATACLALCNADPEPITKMLCIRSCTIKSILAGAACIAAYHISADNCKRDYDKCVRSGGQT